MENFISQGTEMRATANLRPHDFNGYAARDRERGLIECPIRGGFLRTLPRHRTPVRYTYTRAGVQTYRIPSQLSRLAAIISKVCIALADNQLKFAPR